MNLPHRKIYEQYHGIIPKDSNGRTYDIHHIDGNHSNNCIENLKAVSLQEHYDIHYSQGDYGACWLIARKLKMSPNELSELSKKVQLERIKNGTHHFLGSEGAIQRNKKRVKNKTHNFLGKNNPVHKQILEGTHNLQQSDFHKVHIKKLIEDGKFHSNKENICPYCGKKGKGNVMFNWHFNKCKFKENI